jgi:uncharacterized protein (DUF433 family)
VVTISIVANLDRITIEPGKMGGQPCIRGLRFTAAQLLALIRAHWTLDQMQREFPFLEPADIAQALAHASASRPAVTETSRRAIPA